MIQIRVLGPLEVLRDGELVAAPGDRERAVLALLVAQAGEVVSADHLIDRLWGDDVPQNPLNALQAIVSRLRRALGSGGIVVTRKPGYVLETQGCEIDARQFEELVRRARHLGPDDSHRVSELLARALSLWHGSPFADLGYRDVVREEQARLEDLRVSALEDKIEADLALGRHREAVTDLERLVGAHPLRERLRAQLMVALYRSGRQAEAIAAFQETRRLLSEDLGVDPGPELDALYQQILHQDPVLLSPSEPHASEPRTNLPSRITSFIGRDAEIKEVAGLLEGDRLVTVVGPGGSGKTSLAIEVGRAFVDSFDQGVWLVELAPVADAALVVAAIAYALGWPEGASAGARGESGVDRLGTYLRNKHLLLILDNCEHVVQAAAEIADAVVRTCPKVSILATSREVLASAGEFVWTIPPLAVPRPGAEPDELTAYDSVLLFQQRAASAGADAVLKGQNARAAAEICRRLDGMPLAIELAAARARSLPVPEIAQRLDQRFELLTSGGRTIEPRHRTLRAAIDWSHDLLSPEEQTLFARLAVFSGGWTLEAAEKVCAGGDVRNVVDGLARLVDQSLVVSGGDRFSLLETILAYARERLIAAGEEEELRERHAHFFRSLAEAIEPDLRSPDQGRALERLRVEEHNLRRALAWGREHSVHQPDAGLGLAAALGWYWYVGRQVEGRSELKSMLGAAPAASDGTRARALQGLSLALRPAGCIVHASPEAAQAARESVSLFEAIDEPARGAISRLLVAVEGVGGGDVQGFLDMVEQARTDLRREEDAWGLALADFVEMEIRLYHDSPEAALQLGQQAAAQFDALDDSWGRSAVRLHLGFGLRLAGRIPEARQALHEAVALSRETGLPNNLARSLAELGELAVHTGDTEEAERWFDLCQEVVSDLADDTLQALVFVGRADAARYRNDSSMALRHYKSSLTLYRRSEVVRGQARALIGAAAADLDLGDRTTARGRLQEGARLVEEARDPAIHAVSLEQLARLSFADGGEQEGRRLLREAERIRIQSQRPRSALAARDVQTWRWAVPPAQHEGPASSSLS